MEIKTTSSLPLAEKQPLDLPETSKTHPPLSTESLSFPAKPEKQYEILDLRKSLSKKYSKDVVDKVFKQISKLALTHLPESEVHRVELCCHFSELQKEISQELSVEDKKAMRIFNRYVTHTRSEMTALLNPVQKEFLPTHQEIDQIKVNCKAFLERVPLLLERYNEWTCHRALDHLSVLTGDTLSGKEPVPSFEELIEKIDPIFEKEDSIQSLIDVMPYEKLSESFEVLLHQIHQLKDPHGKVTLERNLLYRLGKLGGYQPKMSEEQIHAYAQLFHASFDGTRWADHEEELTPLDKSVVGNINNVYFLKSSLESRDSPDTLKEENNDLVAVFKAPFKGNKHSGAMESLAYDVSQIFGISSGLVPTKQKKLKDMEGSIQIFQDGISWNDLIKKSKVDQNKIVNGISMRSFLEALLPIIVLGNRDVHSENFFIVKKENDEYGIVVFDNEFCFQPNNYILTGYSKKKRGDPIDFLSPVEIKEDSNSLIFKTQNEEEATSKTLVPPERKKEAFAVYPEDTLVKESILPIRCAILALPQADEAITGEDKVWLKNLTSTWPKSFDQFLRYLKSPPGRAKLNKLPGKKLNPYQIKAFKERLHKLIQLVSSDKDYTPRDLLIRLFPLYPAFYNLSRMLYPKSTEFAVGAKTAEYMSRKAVHKGLISQEVGDQFLKEVYKYEIR